MDLSIIDRAFALRDAARKTDLGGSTPDLAPLSRGDNARMDQPAGLPDDKAAATLMSRALELVEASDKNVIDPQSSAFVAELVTAASAPLPMFNDSDFADVSGAPGDDVPSDTRPPNRRPSIGAPLVATDDTDDTDSTMREREDAPERSGVKRAPRKKKGGGSKKDKEK